MSQQKQASSIRPIIRKLRLSISREELGQLSHLQVKVPNFLIIGAQKAGTTWIHANLKRHPEILLPGGKKELEFFSYHKTFDSSSLSDYLTHFNKLVSILLRPHGAKAVGEATPSYFWSINPEREWSIPPKDFNRDIPQSVLNLLGADIKLILCLRNPVDRAVSAYLHHVRYGRIDYTQQRILETGKHYGIIDMGFYYQHLTAWLEKFDLKNFKMLIYEKDIKVNKQETIKSLCDFLEVDYTLYPSTVSVEEFHNKGLEYRIAEQGVYIKGGDQLDFLAIDKDELKALYEIYSADSRALQKLIDVHIPEWEL